MAGVNPAHRGVRSAGALRFVQLFVGLLSVALLARVVGPSAYGVFGLSSSLIAVGHIFISVWGGAYITRNTDEKADYDALAWTCAATSIFATGFMLAVTPFLDGLKGFGGVAQILPVLSVSLLLAGPVTCLTALAQRQGRFDLLAQSESASAAFGLIAGIGLAYSGLGVWSLVGMELARSACRLSVLALRVGEIPRGRCKSTNFRAILTFDGTRLQGRFIQWADQSIPLLVIARFFGDEALGFYVLGWTVYTRIKEVVVGPFAMFALPAVAAARGDQAKIRQLLETWQRLSVFLAYPVIIGFVTVCPMLVAIWLGDVWGGVSLVMQLLVLSGLRSASGAFNGAVLEGMGRPDLQRWVYIAGLAATLTLLPIGFATGVVGIAAAIMLRGWLTWPLGAHYVQRLTGYAASRQFTIALPALGLSGFMALFVMGIAWAWPATAPEWTKLLASIAIGAIVYGVGAFIWMRRDVQEISALLARRSSAPIETAVSD